MSEHELHVLAANLAWTVIHSLWQGGLIAVALAVALAATRDRPPHLRYWIRCAALGAMGLAPLFTFAILSADAPPGTAVAASVEGAGAAPIATSWWSWLASGDLLPWISVLWCVGAAFCSLRLAGGCWQVWRLRRRASGVDLAPRWQRRVEQLARELGVRVRVRVVECAALAVPTAIGWVKPVVLLPARIFTGLSDEQIEALIAHELAHVSRHDYLVNLVQSVLEALLFYHPAVWWTSRGIRTEREYCCDDLAVAATHDGLSYAHALTALESWRGRQPRLGVSTLGGTLMQRIQRLIGGAPAAPRAVRPFHAVAVLLIAGSMGASAFGLAALPGSAQDHDCPCPCHRRQAPAKWGGVPLLDDVPLLGVREGEAFLRQEKLGELEQLERELAELRESIAAIRGELGNLSGEERGRARGGLHLEVKPELDPATGILHVRPHVEYRVQEADPHGVFRIREPRAEGEAKGRSRFFTFRDDRTGPWKVETDAEGYSRFEARPEKWKEYAKQQQEQAQQYREYADQWLEHLDLEKPRGFRWKWESGEEHRGDFGKAHEQQKQLFEAQELHRQVLENLRGIDEVRKLHIDAETLHQDLQDVLEDLHRSGRLGIDPEELHRHIREALRGVREVRKLRVDPKEIHEHLIEALEIEREGEDDGD